MLYFAVEKTIQNGIGAGISSEPSKNTPFEGNPFHSKDQSHQTVNIIIAITIMTCNIHIYIHKFNYIHDSPIV